MTTRQWTGHNLIMPAYASDISGDRTLIVGPIVPAAVRPNPTLLRVLVQYWFTSRPFADNVTDVALPPPVGVAALWHPEPEGGFESDSLLPAGGEALWAAAATWQLGVFDPTVSGAVCYISTGTSDPQSGQGQRASLNDSTSGLIIKIDWRWDDFDIGPWATDFDFTGWVFVRALWEKR